MKVVLKRFLIGKLERKSPFRRPVCIRDDKLKWILFNAIMHGTVNTGLYRISNLRREFSSIIRG